MQSAYDDVIAALRIYHDIPAMIANEWVVIRNIEAQRDKIGAETPIFQTEIDDRIAHINEMRQQREWLRVALARVDRNDLRILELAYMGPTSPQERLNWRGRSFKDVGPQVGMSGRQARRIAYRVMKQMKEEKQCFVTDGAPSLSAKKAPHEGADCAQTELLQEGEWTWLI